jgi:predicted ester cyclase
MVEAFRNALTDLKVTYELEPSGEVVHWSVGGVGVRPLLEVSLPKQRLELAGNEFYRFSGDKITETWSVWNIEGCLNRIAVY